MPLVCHTSSPGKDHVRLDNSFDRRRGEWEVSGVSGHLEVRSVSDEGEANSLLAQGWDLFTVVAGGGEHIHYILTRRAD